MTKERTLASWKQAVGLAALIGCAAFAMASMPAPLQGQCKIVPKCDWCDCVRGPDGIVRCQCYNCTLACEPQQ